MLKIKITNIYFLQLCYFINKSTFTRNSVRLKLNTIGLSFCFKTNLRFF